MRPQDRAAAEDLKNRLIAAGVPVLRFLVYGSRARGTALPESDLDVFLVLPERTPELVARINDAAWEVGFESGFVITTVEFTPEQLERSPLRASPFVRAVEREGVAV